MICLVAIDRIVPDFALGTIGLIASDTPLWRAARRTVPFFIQEQSCSICLANLYYLVQYDIENNLQLSRRAGDDLEHLRTCRLLLQRLRQLVAALLLRLEQPHVLDGNHHLVGKGRHQLDFAVGERFYSVASERNDANRLTLAA